MERLAIIYGGQLSEIRAEILEAIFTLIRAKRLNEIQLNNPPVFQYIDDQFSETVSRINVESKMFILDTGDEDKPIPSGELSNDILLHILDSVEDGDFEVIEESPEIDTDNFVPKEGTMLIAINPCVMNATQIPALIVGKEYRVNKFQNDYIEIRSEVTPEHYFSINEWKIFFRPK